MRTAQDVWRDELQRSRTTPPPQKLQYKGAVQQQGTSFQPTIIKRVGKGPEHLWKGRVYKTVQGAQGGLARAKAYLEHLEEEAK